MIAENSDKDRDLASDSTEQRLISLTSVNLLPRSSEHYIQSWTTPEETKKTHSTTEMLTNQFLSLSLIEELTAGSDEKRQRV